jgi:hypothetical protein
MRAVGHNREMSRWGIETFGDPCRGCAFRWTMPVANAAAIVGGAPQRFVDLAAEASGSARRDDLGWSVSGYLCHVGDSIRIWAERIASVALGNTGPVALYDQDLLATARHYDDVDVRAALWSLSRAVEDWHASLDLVGGGSFEMIHSEVGQMSLADVIRIRAHDVAHHAWDVERTISATSHAQ